jgi:hypothetical protein
MVMVGWYVIYHGGVLGAPLVSSTTREGGSMTREGVDEEIPDAEGQNAAMAKTYSALEDPAPSPTVA